MSTAVATPTLCGCGCGNKCSGRKFLNLAHRLRFEESQVYPRYTDFNTRLVKCQHGTIQTEIRRKQTAVCDEWLLLDRCAECTREEHERLESLKPKPRSRCEARTCDCTAKVPCCGRDGEMVPGVYGSHFWRCPVHHPERSAQFGCSNVVIATGWRD